MNGQRVHEKALLRSQTASCSPLVMEEEDESGSVSHRPLLSVPSWDPEIEETALLFGASGGTKTE